MKYPFQGSEITFTEASRFVAEAVYPGEGEAARKRVRIRIRRAQQNGEIEAGDVFDAGKFFSWATMHEEQRGRDRKWRNALLEVEGLPLAGFKMSFDAEIPIKIRPDSDAVFTPGGDSERMEMLHDIQVENVELKKENSSLRAELERYKAKSQENSRIAREKGRLVGKRDQHGKLKKSS